MLVVTKVISELYHKFRGFTGASECVCVCGGGVGGWGGTRV